MNEFMTSECGKTGAHAGMAGPYSMYDNLRTVRCVYKKITQNSFRVPENPACGGYVDGDSS